MAPIAHTYHKKAKFTGYFHTVGVVTKSNLMAYGLMALGFLLFLCIIQRHYTHPGSTGSIKAAQAAY